MAVATGGGGLPAGAYDAPQAPAGGFKIFINDGEKKIPAFAGMTKGDGMTDGVGMTDNRLVNLKLFAGADTTKMAISNNKDFINASQEEYTTTKQWDLCSRPTYLTNTNTTNTTCPDGIYTVYARFYTKYGQPSEIVSATVTLCHADNTVQCHSGESRNLIQDTEKIPAFAGMTMEDGLIISGAEMTGGAGMTVKNRKCGLALYSNLCYNKPANQLVFLCFLLEFYVIFN